MRVKRLILLVASISLLALWGCSSSMDSAGPQTVVETAEDILRATQFVGADRCGGCHTGLHDGWIETAHTKKLRLPEKASFINDGDDSGLADFFDASEFDLCTEPAADGNFAAYCGNALLLGSDGNGPYIKIGTTTYYLSYTLGGGPTQDKATADANGDGLILNEEAQWKQRYITKIGNSNYILPVQYNAKTQEYVTYHPEDWYDGANDPMAIATAQSYDRRCAGCHVTGLAIDYDGDEWIMSFSDISVSCEACHGPGGQHATSPIKDNIINPATMVATEDLNGDLVVDQIDNLIIRNYVCQRCHSRGAGKYLIGGKTLAYSSRDDGSGNALMYLPGLNWTEYYDISTKTSDYWGDAGNLPGSGDFIASSSHHQQQQDFDESPHAADQSYDHECFICHDSHSTENKHMVATEIEVEGVIVSTTNDDDTLCVACHAGFGAFEDITTADVNLSSNAFRQAIVGHTQHIFDPTDSGASRCSKCHMPLTAKSAIRNADGTGDIHSHTFLPIEPDTTIDTQGTFDDPSTGVPNSCSGCHEVADNADLDDLQDDYDDKFVTLPADLISMQWFNSGHADYLGEPFTHWDDDGEVEVDCARCHSLFGFLDFIDDGTVDDPAPLGTVLDCRACHTEGGSPDLYEDNETHWESGDFAELLSVTFPSGASGDLGDSSNICMACHQGRESGASLAAPTPNATVQAPDYVSYDFINRHYYAAAAILFGTDVTAGYEYGGSYDGQNVYASHTSDKDSCIGCHFDNGNHTFLPEITNCSGCHTGITDFEDLGLAFSASNVDYDGDGTGESFQHEIDGMAALLYTEMQTYATALGYPVFFDNDAYPYFFNDPGAASFGNRYRNFDIALLRAAFNYKSGLDPCSDMHNYQYVLQTLYDSIDDLDGGGLDGSVAGDSVAATRP